MKNSEANIFVFIASIIVGIMISLNISFSHKSSTTYLDAGQYENAMIKKNNLLEDITLLNDQYNATYSKLQKYQGADASNAKVIQEMNNELEKNKLYIGTYGMHGPGIKITLNDAPPEYSASLKFNDVGGDLIHNIDVAKLLNELKSAGAEAIAINGNRIMNRTLVLCNGNCLRINGEQCWAPFTIEAIGNPNVLEEYMNRDGGHLKLMMYSGLSIEPIEKKDDITIPGYNGSLSSKHTKSDVK